MNTRIAKFVEIVSVVGAIILICVDCVSYRGIPSVQNLILDILPSLCFLLLAPSPHEKQEIGSTLLVAYLCIYFLCATLIALDGDNHLLHLELVPMALLILLIVNLKIRSCNKFKNVNNLFRCVEVWNNVEDYARQIRLCVFMLMIIVLCFSEMLPPGFWRTFTGWVDLSAAVLCLLRWAVNISPSSVLGRQRADKIKELVNGVVRGSIVSDCHADSKMAMLYERAQKIMREQQPFLDENFKLEQFATMLYTNKSYLSKTINTMSGRNFCQYLNYYRVEYAVKLINEDPNIKIAKVVTMSGFHNSVSFGDAFNLFKGMSPGDYADSLKLSRK